MATIIINISGDTIAGMNDKMSAANGCYLAWNGEKITSTGYSITIPVTESGTLSLPEGQASGVYYSYTTDGSTTLGADDVLTINYTARASSGADMGEASSVNVTYNPPSGGETGPTSSIDLTTLGLEAGTYVITVRGKAAGRIASALSKEIEYTAEGGGNVTLATFYYEGVPIQFEEGMTWAEFCASDYNTAGFNDYGGDIIYAPSGKFLFDEPGCTSSQATSDVVTRSDDIIVAGKSYYQMVGGFE